MGIFLYSWSQKKTIFYNFKKLGKWEKLKLVLGVPQNGNEFENGDIKEHQN